MPISFDSVRRGARRYVQIVLNLQVHPKLRRHGKVARQPQRGVSRDAAASIRDFSHAAYRHVQLAGEFADAQIERCHQFLPQNLARMDGRGSRRVWNVRGSSTACRCRRRPGATACRRCGAMRAGSATESSPAPNLPPAPHVAAADSASRACPPLRAAPRASRARRAASARRVGYEGNAAPCVAFRPGRVLRRGGRPGRRRLTDCVSLEFPRIPFASRRDCC